MSTIKVANIEAQGSSDQVTADTLLNAPKMWAMIDGAATPSLTDSHNVTGIGDAGVGQYQLTITNDLAAATYAALASHVSAATTANQNAGIDESSARTAGVINVYVHSTSGFVDDDVDVAVVGGVLA